MTALLDIAPAEDAPKNAKAKTGTATSLAMRYCMETAVFSPCSPGAWPPCRCGEWVGSIGYQPGGYDAAGSIICYQCAKKAASEKTSRA